MKALQHLPAAVFLLACTVVGNPACSAAQKLDPGFVPTSQSWSPEELGRESDE
jgi:hypothetical protein